MRFEYRRSIYSVSTTIYRPYLERHAGDEQTMWKSVGTDVSAGNWPTAYVSSRMWESKNVLFSRIWKAKCSLLGCSYKHAEWRICMYAIKRATGLFVKVYITFKFKDRIGQTERKEESCPSQRLLRVSSPAGTPRRLKKTYLQVVSSSSSLCRITLHNKPMSLWYSLALLTIVT